MAASSGRLQRQTGKLRSGYGQCALTLTAVGMAVALAVGAEPAAAMGRLGTLDVISRTDGQMLPVYPKDGRNWVVGNPGQEYSLRFCNATGGRVLAVLSVDGVNAVTGDTASPAQSGYVMNPYECADIHGWRKNLSRTAAFYFTELPDAYATRTGRPENVGVIGVAVFRERQPPVVWKDMPGKIASESRRDTPAPRQEAAAAGGIDADSRASADSFKPQEDAGRMAQAAPAPMPMSKLGTGHGRSEQSYAQVVRFERESPTPNETIAIHYDRRENLVALGILPPPVIARTPNPFPAWTPRFVPDPPRN